MSLKIEITLYLYEELDEWPQMYAREMSGIVEGKLFTKRGDEVDRIELFNLLGIEI